MRPHGGGKDFLDAWTVRCAWGSGPIRGFGVRRRRYGWYGRRLYRRSLLEQLPGGALGQVGRAGDEESDRGGGGERHLERRQNIGGDSRPPRRETQLAGGPRRGAPRGRRHPAPTR